MKYLEDVAVGDVSTGTATYVVTEEEILEVGRRWDPQPFHTDPVAAADSIFGGLVASSVHLFAIGVALGVKADPFAAVAGLGFKQLTLQAPVRPGDVLTKDVRVLSARPSTSRPGVGVIELRNEVRNQDGAVVFVFESAFLVRSRESGDSA